MNGLFSILGEEKRKQAERRNVHLGDVQQLTHIRVWAASSQSQPPPVSLRRGPGALLCGFHFGKHSSNRKLCLSARLKGKRQIRRVSRGKVGKYKMTAARRLGKRAHTHTRAHTIQLNLKFHLFTDEIRNLSIYFFIYFPLQADNGGVFTKNVFASCVFIY